MVHVSRAPLHTPGALCLMIQGKRVVGAVGDIKHHYFALIASLIHLEVVFSAMGQPLGLILAYLPWFMIPGSMLLTCRCAYGPRHGSTCQTEENITGVSEGRSHS